MEAPGKGWFKRQRTAFWHLRTRGLQGYREWQKRQNVACEPQNASRVPKKYGAKPPSTTASDIAVPVFAGLATIPSRVELLREAFNSIYWQVDEVHIFLNNFTKVPDFLRRPRTRIYRSQDYEDYKDVGKFFALNFLNEGILFTIDDDILYPPDYVSRMLSYLAATDFEAVIGVHGFHLPCFPKSFFDRRLFHFRRELEDVAFASVLGTGTTVFDVAKLGIRFEDFPTYGMADIHFATFLKEKRTPALVIPRPAEWLRPLKVTDNGAETENLFTRTVQDAAPHSAILRSVAPWGEEDTLLRWDSLSHDQILSESLVDALRAIRHTIQRKYENVEELRLTGDGLTSRESLPWIELYADIPTREELFIQSFNATASGVLRRELIRGLEKSDTTKALELSWEVLRKKPRDHRVLTQHAELCEKLFLYDEAQSFYLEAIERAGSKDSNATRNIVFDYFKFLVRSHEFENAAIMSSSLTPTHSRTQLFRAFMVLVQLHQGQIMEAQQWLESLFNSPRSSSRSKAVDALIEVIAGMPRKFSDQIGFVTDVTIGVAESSFDELVALLKIATVVGDSEGASKIWESLSALYKDELAMRPEVDMYFTTNWKKGSSLENTIFVGNKSLLSIPRVPDLVEVGPLVSVILIAYNAEDTLGYAIESILNQSYSNIELIIVDDKSDDSTGAIAESWASRDPRIIFHKNATFMGLNKSRNIALEFAQGDFIAFQEAYDVSLPDRLMLQMENFVSGTKAVLGQQMRVDTKGSVQLDDDGSILGASSVTLMVQREAIKEIGPFVEVRFRDDKEYESRIEHFYGSEALKQSPKVLVYSLHSPDPTSKRKAATFEERRKLLLFKESYIRAHSLHQFAAGPSHNSNEGSVRTVDTFRDDKA